MADAAGWVDEQLHAHGLERTGPLETRHARPWATVARAETTGGAVWLKAPAPRTAAEIGTYRVLGRVVPDAILTPLAIDDERAYILLPDAGLPLEREALGAALAAYARVQRALEPHVDELLAAGVTDARPAAMPERFEEALEAVARSPGGAEAHDRLAVLRPELLEWFAELGEAPGVASLDHDDLHHHNVVGPPPFRFLDWGDALVAHPFTAARFPLELAPDPERARDGYLAAYADVAPYEELAGTLELACRVGLIARILVWDRALAAARDDDYPLPDEWTAAPVELALSCVRAARARPRRHGGSRRG